MKLEAGIKRIKELLRAVKDTDIEEIHYEKGGIDIGFRRKLDGEKIKSGATEKEVREKMTQEIPVKIEEVISHSVGLFRDYITPSRKVLTKVGQKVSSGENIGAIESMKIIKEIISPVDGKIVKKLVKHGDPVEYGQKLFEIEVV